MLPWFPALTDASAKALANLRNAGNFQWYLIPFLALIIYCYVTEAQKRNWSIVLAGVAFFGGEFLWEMFNGLVLHWSNRSAMWTTPGSSTAFLIFVGLTIEISMMFAIAGLFFTKLLPEDKKQKILGLPNRLFYILGFALFCVFVEVILNKWGALVWDYAWWRWPNIELIIVAYAGGFWLLTWFYDLDVSLKIKTAMTVALYCADVVAFLVFAVALKWV